MKPWLKILLTVLVTGAVFGGSTYYFVNAKATDDKNNLQSQIDDLTTKLSDAETSLATLQASQSADTSDSSSASSSTTTTDSTATQKTYTNSQYGFSFNYPSTMTATGLTKSANTSSVGWGGEYVVELLTNGTLSYTVDVFGDGSGSLTTFVNNYFENFESGPSHISSTTINSLSAKKFYMAKAGTPASGNALVAFEKSTTAVVFSTGRITGTYTTAMDDSGLAALVATFAFSN